jgi:hypothetical protein
VRTNVNAATAAFARLAYNRTPIHDLNGLHEAHILRASPAPHTSLAYRDRDAGHSLDLGADAGRDVWQHAPETTTRTTMADGEQVAARPNAQPDGIQFVAPDEMDQAGLATALYMLQRFLLRGTMPQIWVDSQGRLPQEETSQLNRISLALLGGTTEAKIHNPMHICLLNKMLNNLRGQHYLIRRLQRLSNLNGFQSAVVGQEDKLITVKKPVVHSTTNHR